MASTVTLSHGIKPQIWNASREYVEPRFRALWDGLSVLAPQASNAVSKTVMRAVHCRVMQQLTERQEVRRPAAKGEWHRALKIVVVESSEECAHVRFDQHPLLEQ